MREMPITTASSSGRAPPESEVPARARHHADALLVAVLEHGGQPVSVVSGRTTASGTRR
jgi:hypothetical protein